MKFNLDHTPYGIFARFLADLILLNILYIITCIPIITIGASTTALYYTFSQRKRGETSMTRTFFVGFKHNLAQASLIWLIAFLLGALLCLNFYIVSFWTQYQTIALAILMCPTVLYCSILSYVFPLLGEFENKTIQLLSNSVLMSLAHFPKTLILLLINSFPLIVLLLLPSFIGGMFYIWLPCIFSLCAYLNTNVLSTIFTPYRPEEEDISQY